MRRKIPYKRNKYRAIRVGKYASMSEAARAEELKLLEKAGKISDLYEQVGFAIGPRECDAVIRYIADFTYTDTYGEVTGHIGGKIVEDVKGRETPVFRLKLKLFRCKFPDHIFVISKAKYGHDKDAHKSKICGFGLKVLVNNKKESPCSELNKKAKPKKLPNIQR